MRLPNVSNLFEQCLLISSSVSRALQLGSKYNPTAIEGILFNAHLLADTTMHHTLVISKYYGESLTEERNMHTINSAQLAPLLIDLFQKYQESLVISIWRRTSSYRKIYS